MFLKEWKRLIIFHNDILTVSKSRDVFVCLFKSLNGGLVMVNFYSQFLTCKDTATIADAAGKYPTELLKTVADWGIRYTNWTTLLSTPTKAPHCEFSQGTGCQKVSPTTGTEGQYM